MLTMTAPKTCTGEKIPIVELAFARSGCARVGAGFVVTEPRAVANLMSRLYGCTAQERFYALHLNSRNEVVNLQEVALGSSGTVGVDPRTLFAGALLSGAQGIILVHNHPSGNTATSNEDDSLTWRFSELSRLLGIKLLDHIVVARGGAYMSYQEKGKLRVEGLGTETELTYGARGVPGATQRIPCKRGRCK